MSTLKKICQQPNILIVLKNYRGVSRLRFFSSEGIKFSWDSIKSCDGFINLVDSTKNIVMMEGFENIRKYYSLFINSISGLVSSSNAGGKVIKNIGMNCLISV